MYVLDYLFHFSCPVGHYCPTGSHAPQRCMSGEYQTIESQATCDECPAGYFCDNTLDIVVLDADAVCPVGHYCPLGTSYHNEFPCPIGTFNNATGTFLVQSMWKSPM